MSLTAYKKKRSFNKTPEPAGKKVSSDKSLHFVIQQHDAQQLHYDFRLEMEGVLKSWAVPKGPSMNPEDKRLAMMVEDHPYEYKDFEGIIPPGNYGAGTVIVWDKGTYEPAEVAINGKQTPAKHLLQQLQKGSLKIILHGEKLTGEFALVHIKGREDNAWLLIKKKDRFAKTTDITKKARSVLSGLKIEQVQKQGTRQWNSYQKKKQPAVKKKKNKPAKKTKTAAANNWLNETAKEQVVIINKKELTFTNLNKLYWPKEKITKRNLLDYYYQVSPYIMPYLLNRPQSLNRFPNGITKPGFYQKDVTGKVAKWIDTYNYTSESGGEKKKYLVCTDEAALLYMANLGCIEMNPWHSTIHKPGAPSWCVIDLDPARISFDKVIEAALVVKSVADAVKIKSYCKTSGSTGLHIFIPLGDAYTYDQSRQLAELIVSLVHHEIPSFTSLERSPAKRKTKIYLDYLQNRSIQTIASAYSVRPKPGATVSAPLHWEEVKKGLSIQDFTMYNMLDRIKETGDVFKPVLGKGINVEVTLDRISKLL